MGHHLDYPEMTPIGALDNDDHVSSAVFATALRLHQLQSQPTILIPSFSEYLSVLPQVLLQVVDHYLGESTQYGMYEWQADGVLWLIVTFECIGRAYEMHCDWRRAFYWYSGHVKHHDIHCHDDGNNSSCGSGSSSSSCSDIGAGNALYGMALCYLYGLNAVGHIDEPMSVTLLKRSIKHCCIPAHSLLPTISPSQVGFRLHDHDGTHRSYTSQHTLLLLLTAASQLNVDRCFVRRDLISKIVARGRRDK
jgi:hypothetical protein